MKPVVLQLIDSFNQGGSERQALQLTRLLHVSGRFDVRVASLSSEGVLRKEFEQLNLGDIPSFPLNSFYDRNAVQQHGKFKRFLKQQKVDILHTHDFYTNVFGMAGGKLAGVPVRIASMRETAGMRSGAQKRVQRFAYALAHQVIANSNAVRDELVRQGVSEEKISVIHNGVDLKRVSVRGNQDNTDTFRSFGIEPSANGQRVFVTIVANMRHPVKDYPTFLRAASRVRNAVPNAEFLLAGEGELMPSLQATARELGIESCTRFLGRCESLAELLSISEVCVLSSQAEGFSNSILEYMAAGKPVVATDVGGAREIIVEGVTGNVVPAGDYERMAERIIRILHSENISEMGSRGREIVVEKFSVEAQLKKTEELYDRLLAAQSTSQEGGLPPLF